MSMIIDISWFGVYAQNVIDAESNVVDDTRKFAFAMTLLSFLIKPATTFYAFRLCGIDGASFAYQPEVQYDSAAFAGEHGGGSAVVGGGNANFNYAASSQPQQ